MEEIINLKELYQKMIEQETLLYSFPKEFITILEYEKYSKIVDKMEKPNFFFSKEDFDNYVLKDMPYSIMFAYWLTKIDIKTEREKQLKKYILSKINECIIIGE